MADDRQFVLRDLIAGRQIRVEVVLAGEDALAVDLGIEAEPGPDLKELEGSYVFNEVADGRTEVVYGLKVEPSFTIPGFLRRQAEKQLVGTALRGLRKRVEALGPK